MWVSRCQTDKVSSTKLTLTELQDGRFAVVEVELDFNPSVPNFPDVDWFSQALRDIHLEHFLHVAS